MARSHDADAAGIAALVSLIALFLAAKSKTGIYVQMGTINNVNKHGLIKKTDEIKVLSAKSLGTKKDFINMSLYGNTELINKARDYCDHQTPVKITYKQNAFFNFFTKAQSPRRVLSIGPVENAKPTENVNKYPVKSPSMSRN